MEAQVAQQPPPRERVRREQREQDRRLAHRGMADRLDREDQRAEHDQQQRDRAVEAPGLGVRPRVERSDDLPAPVGVGAALLQAAAVADVRSRPVAHEPPLRVELVRPQVLALGADPVVAGGVVGEAGRAVAERPAVRVRGQPLEPERAAGQDARVPAGEYRRSAHAILAAAASSPPARGRPSGS